MLGFGRFFKGSTDSHQGQTGLSIECLPNEMLLPILQRTATSRSDKNSVSLVSKRFHELNEDKSVGKFLSHDIHFIIDSLLRDLYRLMFKRSSVGAGQFFAEKELILSIEQLKKQLVAVLKARSFERIDKKTLDIFSNGDAKAIRSKLLMKYGGMLPYVIDSVKDFQFLAATVDKSQWNAIEVIFKTIKLSEKNDITICIHLMLRLCAELKSKKRLTDKHQDYRELLTNACSKLVGALSKEQQMVAIEIVKDGVRLSEEIFLHNLANAFIAVSRELHEQLGNEVSNDFSLVSDKPGT
ncbi:hypothetical protein [Fluoribacter gormanii]|uniref:F-box domain-containing protein n=1 Tax=Fluoribacter gormanii TaxID=464 RepID=A0A377GNS6_9GAMM|nr:hypothetical protein [Fluoribacter gormanii]KTD04726.1 hypothetical protein Lgor_0808 [Fluoribacter gormanii]SIR14549.1 hypothetical protein SAMN05421777_10740 [Fluoribacter gormanii]STO26274.1 Uncharacterised protein [Fluoribacter gormanii]